MWLLVCVFPSDAQPPPPQETENSRQIYITADKLVTDHHHQTAEFIGNVRARQNETLILSDRMTLFYRTQDASPAQQTEIGPQSMEKIEADGHVRITMQDTTGMAAHAVYTAKDRILVLSGSGSKLIRGDNTISGSRIVFDRVKGTITVESGREERVEAVIFSEDNGL
jgi:lipopolysaccharide transport protein LptA